MNKDYTFLAVFHKRKNGAYLVDFPDIDECRTYGNSFADCKKLAREALEYCIHGRQEHRDIIPIPSRLQDIKVTRLDDLIVPITACMSCFREDMKSNPIDRDEHVPKWLENIASKNREKLGDAIEFIAQEIEKDLK